MFAVNLLRGSHYLSDLFTAPMLYITSSAFVFILSSADRMDQQYNNKVISKGELPFQNVFTSKVLLIFVVDFVNDGIIIMFCFVFLVFKDRCVLIYM